MLPVLQVGPLAIQLPGLLMIAGVWLGSALAAQQARRVGLSADGVERLILVGLVAGILGARLGYALRYLEVFARDPLALLALTPVTLAPEVGVGVGLIAALVAGQRRQMRLWPTLDALAPGLAGFAVALSLAHLASGDAFGAPSNVPWAIELWGATRHPAQVYELLAAAGILAFALRLRPRETFPGFAFVAFIGRSAAARLVLEAFRGDSVMWLGGVRAAQVISLAILLGALALLRRLAQQAADTGV